MEAKIVYGEHKGKKGVSCYIYCDYMENGEHIQDWVFSWFVPETNVKRIIERLRELSKNGYRMQYLANDNEELEY